LETCKTCAHWKKDESGTEPLQWDSTIGKPEIPPNFEIRVCASPDLKLNDRPVVLGGFAICGDRHEMPLLLWTGPLHSCNMYWPIEPQYKYTCAVDRLDCVIPERCLAVGHCDFYASHYDRRPVLKKKG